MVATILGLLVLVFVTPSLLGRPPILASIPLLIVGAAQNETTLVVQVGGAVQAYMYVEIRLGIRGLDNTSYNLSAHEQDTYGLSVRVPVNRTSNFVVTAFLLDLQGHYFQGNVTALVTRDAQDRMLLHFTFPDDPSALEELALPPEDFRWQVPRRGSL